MSTVAAVAYDLELESGSTWSMLCRYVYPADINGVQAPAIPQDWVVTAQFRPHANSTALLAELVPDVDYEAGEFTLELTAAQTESFPGVGAWGVELAHPDGEPVHRLVQGKFSTSLQVVR